MIDFDYTAPELLGYRLREVLARPDEPHKIGGVVYVPERKPTDAVREFAERYERRIAELEELVSDLWPRASFTMTSANRASYRERIAALGLEAE